MFLVCCDHKNFPSRNFLLLAWGILLLFLGFLCLLGALSSGAGSDTSAVKGVEGGEFLFVFLDGAELDDWLRLKQWHDGSGELGSEFTLLLGGFTLLQLAVLVDWEENELALVFLQALDVLLT
jgi:hypothetical protein